VTFIELSRHGQALFFTEHVLGPDDRAR